jgi:transcriptional regulator with XRE-family HTH domain
MGESEELLGKLGVRTRAARQQARLTQVELAALCACDPTYISMLERGKRNPPYLTLYRLGHHLKVPLAQLVE